jgi:hypothetical protein
MKKGDVIYVNRGLYKHYGIYGSEKSVFHFSPDMGAEIDPENAYIRETSLAEFAKGGVPRVDRQVKPVFPPDEIVERARSKAGKGRCEYDLLENNCEHFTTWCAAGKRLSKQVDQGLETASAVVETLRTISEVLVERVIASKKPNGGRNKRDLSKL